MKHDKNDLLRRQDCIETIEEITSSMSVCVNTDECHGMKRMQRQAVIELANMPAVQPDHVADIGKNVSISYGHENDLISRQATIDLVGDWIYNPEDLRYHKDVINSIPAAQPEIVRCKDCKHWDTEWSVSESGAHYCPMVDGNRNSDFYCADAERRTDG